MMPIQLHAIGRIAQCHRSLDGRPEPQDLEDGVEGEEERGESGADMADIRSRPRAPVCGAVNRDGDSFRCDHGQTSHAHRRFAAAALFCIETTAAVCLA